VTAQVEVGLAPWRRVATPEPWGNDMRRVGEYFRGTKMRYRESIVGPPLEEKNEGENSRGENVIPGVHWEGVLVPLRTSLKSLPLSIPFRTLQAPRQDPEMVPLRGSEAASCVENLKKRENLN